MLRLLKTHRVVSRQTFLERLEVSPATFKRDLEYLRDRLGAPVVWDRKRRGYRFDLPAAEAASFEMPGLWFNSQEIHALLTMHRLLDDLQPGLLRPHIEPFKQRIDKLLEGERHSSEELRRRIRILHMNARPVEPENFGVISAALLAGRRLRVVHYNRRRDQESERELSPQRLVFYRDNWYLDAWCHLRKGLRSFAVDSIRHAEALEREIRPVPEGELEATLAAGYGIFGGRRTRTARLRFTAERARWVARERWHPRQQGHFEEDGSYVLSFPYSDDRELLMDILRHGAEVEVLAPRSLREGVRREAEAMVDRYR
ncbi:MAG TPA: WYL domain-containing protein [Gammaproteobacteria bacterium]|nr:WYL domain-containing protein [Gammaproteobacteria bacterium]